MKVGERGPQVDDHVVQRAADAADELGLGVRLLLVVQPAQRPQLLVEGDADLRPVRLEVQGAELRVVEDPGEVPALVLVGVDVDDIRARQLQLA